MSSDVLGLFFVNTKSIAMKIKTETKNLNGFLDDGISIILCSVLMFGGLLAALLVPFFLELS